MQAFEKYWADKQAYDEQQRNNIKLVLPDPTQSPMFNYAILFKTIDDRDDMTDTELRYFIHNNFQAIISNVFDAAVSNKYINAFRDPRFVDAFIDVVSRVQYFGADMTIRINLIIYHYCTQAESKKNPEVQNKMLKLGSIVNANRAVALKKYRLPPNFENSLLIARYSDFNMNICVKRVDLLLVTSRQLMDLLGLDELYEVSQKPIDFLADLLVDLYGLDDWNQVLPYYMTDVLPTADDNNPNTQWVTPDVEIMDSTLSLAVLQVLDTKIETSEKLRAILVSYAEGYRIMNYKKPTRFSLRCISGDFPRLRNMVEYLAENEKIYVP